MASGFMAVYLTMPKYEFSYNIEIAISPIGMAMSRIYADMPDTAPQNFQGFIHNGEYVVYRNWLPGSFKTLAEWFHLVNSESIFSARLFSVLIYALNALLFLSLLLKYKFSQQVAFFSAIIFILLPSHLDFGSLIYADIWFPTFWLLALLVLDRRRPYTFFLFSLVLILGFWFHSFILVLLPMPVLVYLLSRFNFKKLPTLLILVLGIVTVLCVQWYLIKGSPDNYLVQALKKYSLFGLTQGGDFHYTWLLKRLLSLVYESGFLIPILIFVYWKRTDFKKSRFTNSRFNHILILQALALIFYIVAFTNWFGIHRHGLGMFAVLLASIGASLLSNLEKRSTLFSNRAGLTAIGMCLLLFAALPLVTKETKELKHQDDKLIKFISNKASDNSTKFAAFFLFEETNTPIGVSSYHRTMSISIQTASYSFDHDIFYGNSNTRNTIHQGLQKLEAMGIDDFQDDQAIVITERSIDLSHMKILDSLSVDNVKAYHLSLNPTP
jgi:hypothetical protein